MRSFVAAIFVAAAVLTVPARGEACGCIRALPLSVHVKEATTIFVGTVESVTGSMPMPIVARFLVDKTYRGQVERRAVVSGSGISCDIAFTKGETYLVYAKEHRGVLLTHECTRTRPASTAGEDVRYLDHLAAGKPQALVYGDVFRAATKPDGTASKQAVDETLHVVVMSAGGRRSIPTDRWGPYQLVLEPGSYRLWVERRGRRVTPPTTVTLRAGDERRLSLTAHFIN